MNQLETAIAQGQYDTVFEALKNSISATSEHDNLNEVVATLAKHLSKTQTPVEEKVVALEVTNKKRKLDVAETGVIKSSESTQGELIQRIERAITAVREGEFVVVVDSEDRENEGDLIIAAEKVTAEKIAFMVNETSGLICVGMQADRIDELKLPQMVEKNTESHGTAFTVSVDYAVGTSTGISASDRAATIAALADTSKGPELFHRPGHIFPLRAKPTGVLERPGHTEASVDLPRLAGLFPAGAMCEIVKKDGSMMRLTALRKFAAKNGLQLISIEDLIKYRQIKGN